MVGPGRQQEICVLLLLNGPEIQNTRSQPCGYPDCALTLEEILAYIMPFIPSYNCMEESSSAEQRPLTLHQST